MASKFGKDFTSNSVGIIKGRVRNGSRISELVDQKIDSLIKDKKWIEGQKFIYVLMTFLYGTKNNLKVNFGRINKKYGDLSISVELDMKIIEWADQYNLELLSDIFTIAALEALIQVGHKYKIPTDFLESERKKYAYIPSTIDQCIHYDKHQGPESSNSVVLENQMCEAGGETLDEDEWFSLVIEYVVDGMGTDADLKKRYAVQDAVDELLKDADLGFCDGGSIGSGTMEINCFVTDVEKARDVVTSFLDASEFSDYSKIYTEDQ